MHEEFWFMRQTRCTSMLNSQFIVQVYFLLKNLSLLFSVLLVASEAETQGEFFESAPIHVSSCAEFVVSEGRQLPKLISCSYVTSYSQCCQNLSTKIVEKKEKLKTEIELGNAVIGKISAWGSLTFKLIQTQQKWREKLAFQKGANCFLDSH